MTGKKWLEESDRVPFRSIDLASESHIYWVDDIPGISEVFSDYRPLQGNREAWLSRPGKSHTHIDSPPHTLVF
jgi:hypothetical protein